MTTRASAKKAAATRRAQKWAREKWEAEQAAPDERSATIADQIRDPQHRLRRQHNAGIHTDCDRSTCEHWLRIDARITVRYRGTNRDGRSEVGTIEFRPERLAGVVKGFYDRRYRTLEVFDGDVQIAGITQNEDTRRRTWWSEDRDV